MPELKPRFTLMAIFLFCLLPIAIAQNDAAVSGTITDGTGAVVAQANVKLTSRAQGTARTVQTNEAGIYQFSFLQPGIYDIDVAAPGFKTLTRKDLTLAVAQNLRIDLSLSLGNVSENVTVSAATESVNTESADIGAVVDNTRVVEMPLNGRTFYSPRASRSKCHASDSRLVAELSRRLQCRGECRNE